jgi:hypothetical protein
LPLRQSSAGSSGSFLVRADDGMRYWCKAINNPQGTRVPINEQIVGRFAALLAAACCAVKLVRIPSALVGWEYRVGYKLEDGWVHGSVDVPGSLETHQLDHRTDDDNAKRDCGFFVVFDWLWGQDEQWLEVPARDHMYYSHDHGHYFPGGPSWTTLSIAANATDSHEAAWDASGLDRDECRRIATRLEGLDSDALLEAVSTLPAEWPISDDELRALADWAAHRASGAAERLRRRAP